MSPPPTTHAEPDDPLVGVQVGEYLIRRVLGRGGMGVVYEAEDTALGIPVALKAIGASLARDGAFVRRFRAEARAMARVASPHIVRVMALRQTEHGLFIVMEYVDGGTLHDRMDAGPIPWATLWPVAREMLLALEAAHAVGVVHRDIKPRNVMLTTDGTVKVTDFGLAKTATDREATVTQAVSGTLAYMSPEQVRAVRDIDGRSDLFSLALTLYEALAGRLPFDRDAGEFGVMRAIVEEPFPPPTRFRPEVPDGVARVLMWALEKDPARRPAGAAAMREALEAVSDPAGASGSGRHRLPPIPGGPRRVPVALLGGLAAVLLGAVVVAALWGGPDDDPVDDPRDTSRVAVLTPPDTGRASNGVGGDTTVGEGERTPVDPVPTPPQPQPTPPVYTPPVYTPPQPPPPPGYIAVVPAGGVTYSVNGSRIAQMSGPLRAGRYTVRCEAGGLAATTRVTLGAGETEQVACYTPSRAVSVNAVFEDGPSSWVSVFVDGQPAGQTPTRLTLGPGRHVVSVSRAGYDVLDGPRTVEVAPRFDAGEPGAERLSFRVRVSTPGGAP